MLLIDGEERCITSTASAPPCDAPRDVPRDIPCDTIFISLCSTMQAPCFRPFSPLPRYLPHQKPKDACFVEERCLAGADSNKVHLAVYSAKYPPCACIVARDICRVCGWRMHFECIVHARCTRARIIVHAYSHSHVHVADADIACYTQQVLAFSTMVHNIGCAAFVVGVPTGVSSKPGYVHGMRTTCARHVHGMCMCMCMCTACAKYVHGMCTACAVCGHMLHSSPF